MAGNDWINSYLEAILDVGPGLDDAKTSLLLRERGRFSPTRYFVEQVITGFDETDLHRSWVRAAATRSPQERNTRLENMCWRIWNLARQKKQLEGEEAQRIAKRRLERDRGRREAIADMSEDLSEGEKGDTVSDISAHGDSIRGRMPRISSVDAMETWVSYQKGKKLYIVLISLHGLIRGENMELGRDSDTGGQVKYVVELARALGSMPGVYRVDLLTRQVSSPEVDWSYGEPTEMLTPLNSESFMEDMGRVVVLISSVYHLVQKINTSGEQIGDGQPVWPVAIHGHYADAGDSAALLSGALNVPMLFTGHSLGRDKLEQLLKQGRISRDEINTTYKIMRRIEAEELALDASEIVITSTRQEIEQQWRLYDGFDPILERKLRARIRRNVSCYGRFMPRMVIIPPGMEFHHIVPHDGDMDGETEGNEDHPRTPDPVIWSEIMRFFTNPRKPMILALARPDPKKNITTLVKAFGECRPLRELANLTLIMGNRDGIDEMSSTSASVLLSILKLIDKYDLYGQVAYPKHHKQSDVPDIYRLAAKTKGVFINPAFIEPFGLTLIEAAAYGLPIVAPEMEFKETHCNIVAASCKPRHPQWQRTDDGTENSDTDSPGDSLRDIQDISLNLKFSLDGHKNEASGNPENSDENAVDGKSKLENAVLTWSKGFVRDTRKAGFTEKSDQNTGTGKFPALRRRKHIFVIAVDCDTNTDTLETAGKILEAFGKEKTEGSVGFILSTSMSISEVHSFLVSGGLSPSDFDAFVCNSGSDLYYSSLTSEDSPFVLDLYYHSHIEYRWGGEGLRKSLVRWTASINDKMADNERIVVENEQVLTEYCYAFKVQKPGMVPPVKELRKLMRIHALRCHVIYCQNGTKLNLWLWVLLEHIWILNLTVCLELMYLYVRWGVDLSNIVVFVGESGDTDYEGLLGGVHKTVILKGVCASNQLHANRTYPLTDVVPFDSPNIVQMTEDCSGSDIRSSLEKVGVLKG
ncbi:putative sucrose-phosphate synthase 1 [Vitis vinifera]|uniref:sucrose-phosphate synthase n=1 Tax=Vitis vinifera TaxID=29760 RepID=A0A438J8D9_VITVI|nr:putative sucrose-phosphate synthase 1 [Vitis vinifera]